MWLSWVGTQIISIVIHTRRENQLACARVYKSVTLDITSFLLSERMVITVPGEGAGDGGS